MATKSPLVMYDGRLKLIQTGDETPGQSEAAISKSIAIRAESFGVVGDSMADRAQSIAIKAESIGRLGGGGADSVAHSIAIRAESIAQVVSSQAVLDQSLADIAISYSTLVDSELYLATSISRVANSFAFVGDSVADRAEGRASEATSIGERAQSLSRVNSFALIGNSIADLIHSRSSEATSIAERAQSLARTANPSVAASYAYVADSVSDIAVDRASEATSIAIRASSLARIAVETSDISEAASLAIRGQSISRTAESEGNMGLSIARYTQDYLSTLAINKYEEITTEEKSVFNVDFDIAANAVSVYIEGIRQQASAFSVTGTRQITITETLDVGQEIAILGLNADLIQDVAVKADKVSGTPTDKVAKLTSFGNLADAGFAAADVVVKTGTPVSGDGLVYNGTLFVPSASYRKNLIINGNFNVWQRGTGAISVPNNTRVFGPDRWSISQSSDGTLEMLQGGDNLPTGEFAYHLAIHPTVADASISSSQYAALEYILEGLDTSHLFTRPITVSFWVYSGLTGIYHVSFSNAAGSVSYITAFTVNSANTWEYKTVTLTMPAYSAAWNVDNTIGLRARFCLAAGSTFHGTAGSWAAGNLLSVNNQVNFLSSTSYYFSIKRVQLELGSVATPFEFRPFAEELSLCQRYYEKSYDLSMAPGNASVIGETAWIAPITGAAYGMCDYKVNKRIGTHPIIYSVGTGTAGYVRNISTSTDIATSQQVAAQRNGIFGFTAADVNLYGWQWAVNAEF